MSDEVRRPARTSRRRLVKGAVATAGALTAASYVQPSLRALGVPAALAISGSSQFLDTFTQGYWSTHTGLGNDLTPAPPNTPGYTWPPSSLNGFSLGNVLYTQLELMHILNQPSSNQNNPHADASLILGQQLIAAKLNVLNGADPSIQPTINQADALLGTYDLAPNGINRPFGAGITVSSTLGQQLIQLNVILTAYNQS